jgi:hypothetical protein
VGSQSRVLLNWNAPDSTPHPTQHEASITNAIPGAATAGAYGTSDTISVDGVVVINDDNDDDIDDDGGEWRRVLEMTSAEAVVMAVFFASKTSEFK